MQIVPHKAESDGENCVEDGRSDDDPRPVEHVKKQGQGDENVKSDFDLKRPVYTIYVAASHEALQHRGVNDDGAEGRAIDCDCENQGNPVGGV